MAEEPRSQFEHRNERGWLSERLEQIEDAPRNLIGRGRAITDSAKRELWATGIVGQATVLKAPRAPGVVGTTEGAWRARIELPGRPPYDAKVWQSYSGWEWRGLQPGMLVECRVDAADPRKILLCAAEANEPQITATVSSADIVATGRRATGTVVQSAPFGKKAPGTSDEIYLINLDLASDEVTAPWRVQIAQRVPLGAEALVAPGVRLAVAYLTVDGGDSVAIDWPASTAAS